MVFLSRSSRFLTFLFALLQLSLPGALGVIDAMASRTTAAHAEDQSHRGCPTTHTDACVVCRYLSGAAAEARSETPVLVAAAVLAQPLAADGWAPRSAGNVARHSRAPPENLI